MAPARKPNAGLIVGVALAAALSVLLVTAFALLYFCRWLCVGERRKVVPLFEQLEIQTKEWRSLVDYHTTPLPKLELEDTLFIPIGIDDQFTMTTPRQVHSSKERTARLGNTVTDTVRFSGAGRLSPEVTRSQILAFPLPLAVASANDPKIPKRTRGRTSSRYDAHSSSSLMATAARRIPCIQGRSPAIARPDTIGLPPGERSHKTPIFTANPSTTNPTFYRNGISVFQTVSACSTPSIPLKATLSYSLSSSVTPKATFSREVTAYKTKDIEPTANYQIRSATSPQLVRMSGMSIGLLAGENPFPHASLIVDCLAKEMLPANVDLSSSPKTILGIDNLAGSQTSSNTSALISLPEQVNKEEVQGKRVIVTPTIPTTLHPTIESHPFKSLYIHNVGDGPLNDGSWLATPGHASVQENPRSKSNGQQKLSLAGRQIVNEDLADCGSLAFDMEVPILDFNLNFNMPIGLELGCVAIFPVSSLTKHPELSQDMGQIMPSEYHLGETILKLSDSPDFKEALCTYMPADEHKSPERLKYMETAKPKSYHSSSGSIASSISMLSCLHIREPLTPRFNHLRAVLEGNVDGVKDALPPWPLGIKTPGG